MKTIFGLFMCLAVAATVQSKGLRGIITFTYDDTIEGAQIYGQELSQNAFEKLISLEDYSPDPKLLGTTYNIPGLPDGLEVIVKSKQAEFAALANSISAKSPIQSTKVQTVPSFNVPSVFLLPAKSPNDLDSSVIVKSEKFASSSVYRGTFPTKAVTKTTLPPKLRKIEPSPVQKKSSPPRSTRRTTLPPSFTQTTATRLLKASPPTPARVPKASLPTRTVTRPPVTRTKLPQRVPIGTSPPRSFKEVTTLPVIKESSPVVQFVTSLPTAIVTTSPPPRKVTKVVMRGSPKPVTVKVTAPPTTVPRTTPLPIGTVKFSKGAPVAANFVKASPPVTSPPQTTRKTTFYSSVTPTTPPPTRKVHLHHSTTASSTRKTTVPTKVTPVTPPPTRKVHLHHSTLAPSKSIKGSFLTASKFAPAFNNLLEAPHSLKITHGHATKKPFPGVTYLPPTYLPPGPWPLNSYLGDGIFKI